MGKRRSLGSSSVGAAGNGIMGTGIHGVVGSVTTCSSTDQSFYCQLSRFYSSIVMIIGLLFIVYLIYIFVSQGLFKKKR
jgi:hypothetical protein